MQNNNRVIKFRVWDEMERKYLFQGLGLTLDDINDKNTIIPKAERSYQQFTGLLDKNGKEIYDGDILIGNWCKGWFREHKHKSKSKFQAIWLNTGFELKGLDYCSNSKFRTFPLWQDLEIIGNIFENPELLNNK